MRILSIMMIFLGLISCAQQPKNNLPNSEEFFIPVEITRPVMEKFVNHLPVILRKAKDFQAIPKTQQLSDADYNMAFYAYLYTDTNLTSQLKDMGFATFQDFGSFYNSMLEAFILIQKNGDIVQEAVTSIPQIEKELDITSLKLAREQNNADLERKVKLLQDYLLFYKNIMLVNQFIPMLSAFNE
ncbi:MAG: hypothetical protein ACRCS8_00910 [Brevinema sp.]